jgi:hypothetical protein
VIQNYTIEGKIPIYLDRGFFKEQGVEPIECGFFSKDAMLERQVIQHDPLVVAQTVKALFLARKLFPKKMWSNEQLKSNESFFKEQARLVTIPSDKFSKLSDYFADIPVHTGSSSSPSIETSSVRSALVDIIWSHQDIPFNHLDTIKGITCVPDAEWRRDQRWDNIFSFYDPQDKEVKIRQDRFENRKNLEVAFLIAVGQSLLGNYADKKKIDLLHQSNIAVGRVYHLHLTETENRSCYFDDKELKNFLQLSRMVEQNEKHFTRVINGREGFTPPGLLMGLMYMWYLDNRLASHIEYKMSIMKVRQTDLIPDQKTMRKRREKLIGFFREAVFGKHCSALYSNPSLQ